MKFEEWKKCYEGLLTRDKEAVNLMTIFLNEVMKSYGFQLTPDCKMVNDLYLPWVILGKIAWEEKYPQIKFKPYPYSDKLIKVVYNHYFIVLILK